VCHRLVHVAWNFQQSFLKIPNSTQGNAMVKTTYIHWLDFQLDQTQQQTFFIIIKFPIM
jgi:hypothetical protein